MPTVIQLRRGTSAEWYASNPILANGEPGIATDTNIIRFGNGIDHWNDLPVASMPSAATLLTLTEVADPGPANAGHLTLYAKKLAGRILPKIVGPAGQDTALQPFFGRNKIGSCSPAGNSTLYHYTGGYHALTLNTGGALALRTSNLSSLFQRMRRIGITTAATAGLIAGHRTPYAQITTGGSALGSGFFKVTRFGISDPAEIPGARMFVGVCPETVNAANIEPSTMLNCIGAAQLSTSTNLHIVHGGTVAQPPIDLGTSFPCRQASQDPYELVLFSPQGSEKVYWEVNHLETGASASGTIENNGGVNMPTQDVLLNPHYMWRTNNAQALAVGIDFMSDYIETDY